MGGAQLTFRRASEVERHGLDAVCSNGFWDVAEEREPKIHRIHPYPAKFPAFLTSKAIDYASQRGLQVRSVGDLFCGCGTVALEARREGVDFWGCDINPVATLIARAKSTVVDSARFRARALEICDGHRKAPSTHGLAEEAVARLTRWYTPSQVKSLAKLLNAIDAVVPLRSSHRDPFLCAFSAILKGASQWRARAVKPHLDLKKSPADPLLLFKDQCEFMAKAYAELPRGKLGRQNILTANVLSVEAPSSGLDLIVTSPPYVTSYEYADLHQLSALWLGYADDYRHLRTGSIGSSQHELNFGRNFKHLNSVGMRIVFALYDRDQRAARSVANYYLDMQQVAKRAYDLLHSRGMAVVVIGNTQYKGVLIDNACHLSEALLNAGFKTVEITKRRISNKAHTPFRDDEGRFSAVVTSQSTYAEEFILFASK